MAALGIVIVIAFVAVLQVSVAGVFRQERPQLALAWAPYDARARAQLSVLLVENRASAAAQDRATQFAREAIRRDPIAPAALRTLAMSADADGPERRDQAFALMKAAERLSRRDQATQIWLIEHSIRTGRPDLAMAHFDTAFRISETSQEVLIPLLANALADRQMFSAVVARLRRGPEWKQRFLAYLVDYNADPQQTTQLVREFLDADNPDELKIITWHLQRLAGVQEYPLGWELYTHFGLGPTSGALQNGGFEKASGVLPFDWWYAEESDLWAMSDSDPGGAGSVLRVAALSGRTGEVARQLVRLPAGNYRIGAEFGDLPTDPFERPELRVTCAEKAGPNLLQLKPAGSGAERRTQSAEFVIGRDCPFQWLSVAVAGDATEGETVPWIDNIEIARTAH